MIPVKYGYSKCYYLPYPKSFWCIIYNRIIVYIYLAEYFVQVLLIIYCLYLLTTFKNIINY